MFVVMNKSWHCGGDWGIFKNFSNVEDALELCNRVQNSVHINNSLFIAEVDGKNLYGIDRLGTRTELRKTAVYGKKVDEIPDFSAWQLGGGI